MHGVRHTADGLPYGRSQRGRKVKEGRRWLMNLRVTTLVYLELSPSGGIVSSLRPLRSTLPFPAALRCSPVGYFVRSVALAALARRPPVSSLGRASFTWKMKQCAIHLRFFEAPLGLYISDTILVGDRSLKRAGRARGEPTPTAPAGSALCGEPDRILIVDLHQCAVQIHMIPQGGTGSTCSLLVLREAEASTLILRGGRPLALLRPFDKLRTAQAQHTRLRNDLLVPIRIGSSCECFIPLEGKIAARLWLDL